MTESFNQVFSDIESKLKHVKVLNLTTADGFPLFTQCSDGFDLETDKLSAVTSSLTALSKAAAKQLLNSQFESTCIETDKGLLYMIQTNYQDKQCILSMLSGDKPNLAQIRYFMNKLAKYIETATLSADK